VTGGAATVNPDRTGTKCAFWYQVTLAGGASAELRLRLRPAGRGDPASTPLGEAFSQVLAARRAEADEFYAELTPREATADEAAVMRQASPGAGTRLTLDWVAADLAPDRMDRPDRRRHPPPLRSGPVFSRDRPDRRAGEPALT
jgi:hypothetical protein